MRCNIMIKEKIELINKERFATVEEISKAKLERAAELAIDKIEKNLSRFAGGFTSPATNNLRYEPSKNNDWVNGMHTGQYWLAYELTGNIKFRHAAENHLKSFQERFENKVALSDHDVGFLYVPSCVAAYKLTGNEEARKLALDAAKHLYDFSFSEKGGFIIRVNGHNPKRYSDYRTMMDTLMNISLFLWAHRETGEEKYLNAAIAQYRTTIQYLVRSDASTFHHYQFDPDTDQPVRGVTWQGFSDDSCWSRGQAWGVYGLAIAYSYTKDELLPGIHRDLAYYFLNKLPDDYIPYWDLIFTQGSTEPRDSSASAIVACGLHEMSKHTLAGTSHKKFFMSAGSRMLEALIDKCGCVTNPACDGILCHVTHALPQGIGIDECTVFGDYFYLEALVRWLKPDWQMYW